MAQRKVTLRVDGRTHRVLVEAQKPLLYTLRDELGLNNPRFGCGLAQCGACMIQLDGTPVRSCVMPTSAADGRVITTVAGLGSPEKPHPLQSAYVEEQVPQCGVCTNGFLMAAAALLRDNPDPTDADIRAAFDGLVCRCGTHLSILRAVKRAAREMA